MDFENEVRDFLMQDLERKERLLTRFFLGAALIGGLSVALVFLGYHRDSPPLSMMGLVALVVTTVVCVRLFLIRREFKNEKLQLQNDES